jgi:hypothetical protein
LKLKSNQEDMSYTKNCCKTCKHIILRKGKMSFCMEKGIYINPNSICGEYNNVNDVPTVT